MFSNYLVMLFALCFPFVAQAERIEGRILRVDDGATLTLVDSTSLPHVIHLLGIDAPAKLQDFGREAQSGLSAIAANQQAEADCRLIDFGATLCVVKVAGRDLGLEMLRAGFAWWSPEQAKKQTASERADYQQAEFNAKIRRLGLWNSKNPTPPWEWRLQNRR